MLLEIKPNITNKEYLVDAKAKMQNLCGSDNDIIKALLG